MFFHQITCCKHLRVVMYKKWKTEDNLNNSILAPAILYTKSVTCASILLPCNESALRVMTLVLLFRSCHHAHAHGGEPGDEANASLTVYFASKE